MDKMLAADPSSKASVIFAQQRKEGTDGIYSFEIENEPDDFWNKLIKKNQNDLEPVDKIQHQQENDAEFEIDRLEKLNISNGEPVADDGGNEDLIKDYLLQEYQ